MINSSYVRKKVKSDARKALGGDGVRLKLIFAVMTVAVSAILLLVASYLIFFCFIYKPTMSDAVADARFKIVLLCMTAVGFFAISPLAFGIAELASGLSRGEALPLAVIFSYYRGKKLLRAWLASVVTLLPTVILAIPPVLNKILGGHLMWLTGDEPLARFLGFVVAAVVLMGFLLLSGQTFPVAAAVVNGGDLPVLRCIGAGIGAARRRLGKILVYRLSFTLWILLSLTTVGVLFVLFTIPYMLISYSYFSAELICGEHRTAPEREVTFDER